MKTINNIKHAKKLQTQLIKSTLLLFFSIFSFIFSELNAETTINETANKKVKQSNKKITDAHITGHVVDAETGKHIPYATIAIPGTTIGVVTDGTGHYVLRNVPEGDFTIVAKYIGYKTQEKNVTIEKGKTIEINFDIEAQAISTDQIVVSATRNEAEKKDVSVIVNVLSDKMFENTSSATIAEGVAFQPGVRVEYTCANCGVPQLMINGLQGEYSQILLNSRPIFSSLASVYNLEQLPASMIDRVEVIRGGGSALFGSNAIAGVVNIITKEPMYNSVNVSSILNVFEDGKIDRNVSFGGSFVSDDYKTGIYIYGIARDRDSYDRDEDGFSEIPKLKNESMGFRLTHRTGDYSKLTAEYHRMTEFRRGGNKFDLQPHETDVTEQLKHLINGGGLQYDIFSKNQHHYLSVYTSGQWIDRESYFGADQDLNAYGKTDDRTLVAGAQYIFTGEKPIILPYEFTFGFEWNENSLQDKMLGYNRNIDQTVNIFGGYIQNEWKSDELNFVIGARLDKHNLIDNIIFTPRTSIRYSPADWDWVSLRASYASGYRAPQVYNEDLHVGAVGGDVWLIELDPDLKPEYSNSFSASADFYKSFGHDLQTNLLIEGFYTILDDVFSLDEKGRDENGNLIFVRRNASGAKVLGINIEGIIGIIDIFELQAGFTIQQSRYNENETWSENPNIQPQKKMFRSPDNYGYFTISADIIDNFKASLFGKYTGKMLVQHLAGYAEQDEEVETPAFFDMGIKLNYLFDLTNSLNLNISAGVKNMFDQFQKDLDKGPLRDAGFIYGPLAPKTYFVELKFNIS